VIGSIHLNYFKTSGLRTLSRHCSYKPIGLPDVAFKPLTSNGSRTFL